MIQTIGSGESFFDLKKFLKDRLLDFFVSINMFFTTKTQRRYRCHKVVSQHPSYLKITSTYPTQNIELRTVGDQEGTEFTKSFSIGFNSTQEHNISFTNEKPVIRAFVAKHPNAEGIPISQERAQLKTQNPVRSQTKKKPPEFLRMAFLKYS